MGASDERPSDFDETIEALRALGGQRVLMQMRTSIGAADILTVRGVLDVAEFGEAAIAVRVGDSGELLLHFDIESEMLTGSSVASDGTVLIRYPAGAVVRCRPDE